MTMAPLLRALLAAAAFLIGIGAWERAEAQCASLVVAPVSLSYDPASASDATTTFNVTVTNNTCGAAASIDSGVANGLVDATGAVGPNLTGLPVSYDLRLQQSGDEIFLNSPAADVIVRPVTLDQGQSQTTVYTARIAAGSVAPYNQRNPPFVGFARRGTDVTNTQSMVNLNLISTFAISVGGVSSTGLINFGVLTSGEANAAVAIHLQAPSAFRVHLASQHSGVMRHIGFPAYSLPYTATLGAATINANTSYLDANGTAGNEVLQFEIDPDTSALANLRAGVYRDVITLTIWPTT